MIRPFGSDRVVCAAAIVVVTWLVTSRNHAVEISFEKSVAPILSRRCVSCHNDRDLAGDFSLQTRSAAIQGGESGQSIVPGDVNSSFLLDYISGVDPEMPQEDDPLSPDQVAVLRKWIATGAKWPDGMKLEAEDSWWSRQPLARPPVPDVPDGLACRVRTPIDAFIIATQRKHGLALAPEADRRTLIRRLSFDLLGLPPQPDEVEQFVRDRDPKAYEKLVDRLLASPRYGERWARHWLDVVHYGDTHGFDKDKVRDNAWPYRDYVIQSLNNDKPYTRFVKEQLAGDYFYPGTRDGIVALGFIAAGPFDWVGHIEVGNGTMEKKRVRNLDRDDMVASTMNTFVSTTVQCARCHNHKFDPISQQDYYGLQAVFAAVDRADRPIAVDPETARRRALLTKRLTELREEQQSLGTGAAQGTGPELAGAVDAPSPQDITELGAEIASIEEQLAALPAAAIVYAAATTFPVQGAFIPTGGKPREIFILKRGDEQTPDTQFGPVGPSGLAALPQLSGHFDLPEPHDEGQRRAALAEWIVARDNPLAWRSIVNRIWQYHFGRGIVATPNDFGRMGTKPTHPQLLDWLAVEFRDRGQSLKTMHRLIVNSSVYRQSARHHEPSATIDGENRYLWRMHRKKLEAEAVRDAVLVVAGKLNCRMGGPGFRSFGFKDDHSPHYNYDEQDMDDPDSHRRSVYRFIVRSVPDPFMTTLDCADPSLSVAQRNETLTALQALALLNNHFMVRMSAHFATRVDDMGDSHEEEINAAFRLALGRSPSARENAVLVSIADEHGLENACRAILNLNEFVFVD